MALWILTSQSDGNDRRKDHHSLHCSSPPEILIVTTEAMIIIETIPFLISKIFWMAWPLTHAGNDDENDHHDQHYHDDQDDQDDQGNGRNDHHENNFTSWLPLWRTNCHLAGEGSSYNARDKTTGCITPSFFEFLPFYTFLCGFFKQTKNNLI